MSEPRTGPLQLSRAFTGKDGMLTREWLPFIRSLFAKTQGLSDGLNIYQGTGTPEAVITAPVGSMYLRQDGGAGTTLYVKESGTGNTGWVGK